MTQQRQSAKERHSSFYTIISSSDLTMVHDTAGEVSPDVTETLKEKTKLAKSLALTCIEREIQSFSSNWLMGMIFSKKRLRLEKEREEILNLR